MRCFYDSLKKFANMFNIHVQLVLSEINIEEIREAMKFSSKYRKITFKCSQPVNHRYDIKKAFGLL
ncbi:unnamed protein product [Heterobilharzia americana]|nr:unnamed protein product [Heterobilharzia americana]